MKNGIFTLFYILAFLFGSLLYSQDKSKKAPPKDKKEEKNLKSQLQKEKQKLSNGSKDTDKTEDKKQEQAKEEKIEPSRYETGTVQINPKIVASNHRILNLKLLKNLKSSFINLGQEEEYKKLVNEYVNASTEFQKRDYVIARRKYEKNYNDINIACEPLVQKYQDTYLKLFSENIQAVIDLKVNSSMSEEYIAVLEKYLNAAAQFNVRAENLLKKKEFIDAIPLYKKSIFNLLKLTYLLQKDKIKELTPKERFEQGFIIEDDYIPEEYRNFYDDSKGHIHQERKKEREEERLETKKILMEKYDIKATASPMESDEDKKEPAPPKKKEGSAKVDKKQEQPKSKETKEPVKEDDTAEDK